MRTVFPKGTTLYLPGQCCNGYTLIYLRGRKTAALIDMLGHIVHSWTPPEGEGIRRAKLLPNGHVLLVRGGMSSTHGAVQEYNWAGRLVWEYVPEGKMPHKKLMGPHHDAERLPNGNTLVICRVGIPKEYRKKIENPRFQGMKMHGDVILEVTPRRSIAWRWNSYKHLNLNYDRVTAESGWDAPEWDEGHVFGVDSDWTHVNTVRAVPRNQWNDRRFRPGNVILSPRNLDQIFVVDRKTKRVEWSYRGKYWGGLSGQHEPHMIPEGYPGAGNILVFDNGTTPTSLAHVGRSCILEVQPVSKTVVWAYQKSWEFYSPFGGSVQRLSNGNTLICAATAKRVFEVTVEGRIVWEHVQGGARAYRYPYGYCPQMAQLERPWHLKVDKRKGRYAT